MEGAMIVERMLQHAAAEGATRKTPKLAAWNVGRCVRQVWYGEHGVAGEPLPGRALLRFELGNLVEEAVCRRVEATGIDFMRTDMRKTDNVTVPGLGFRCRADFLFACPEDLQLFGKSTLESGDVAIVAYADTPPAKGDTCGGEIKSMSDFAFAKAQCGVLDDAYLWQIECGLRALDVRWWVCIAYRSETSQQCEVWVSRDDARWAAIQAATATIRGNALPPRPYALDGACSGAKTGACVAGKTPGKGLPHKHCGGTGQEPGGPFINTFPCGYCSVKAECWSDVGELQLRFVDGKPRWRVAAQEVSA
jgi:hypothetical protein